MSFLSQRSQSKDPVVNQNTMPIQQMPVNENAQVQNNEGTDTRILEVEAHVQEQLLRQLDISRFTKTDRDEMRRIIEEKVEQILFQDEAVLNRQERQQVITDVVNDVLGFGPIEPYLADSSVTEIMVNSTSNIYVERNGMLQQVPSRFRDEMHVHRIIEKIIAPLGRRIDESSPMVDARLPDGSRVNAVIPPLSVDGPLLTVRKFAKDPFKADDLVNIGTISPAAIRFLQFCVTARINIVISGGTGTGKTTLLGVLASFIDPRERIVTIENPVELQLKHPHVARLETRPSNIENKGEVTQRDLVRNALRMRPDRIIVGEVRAGEAFDMLQAMNTGHEGSMTTVHANSTRDALARIENMVLMAGMELPLTAVREQIASAIHIVVQLRRFPDGTRRVSSICEVSGMESSTITMQELFTYKQNSQSPNLAGGLAPTGLRPQFAQTLEEKGIRLAPDYFLQTAKWG